MSPGLQVPRVGAGLGVPLRIELGPKDLEKGSVACVKRHEPEEDLRPHGRGSRTRVPELLDEVQHEMFEAARSHGATPATFPVDDYDSFKEKLEDPGGFLLAHWCGERRRARSESRRTPRRRSAAWPSTSPRRKGVVCCAESRPRNGRTSQRPTEWFVGRS